MRAELPAGLDVICEGAATQHRSHASWAQVPTRLWWHTRSSVSIATIQGVRMKTCRATWMLLAAASAVSGVGSAATLQPLVHQPPVAVDAGPPFLLTDGSVMFQGDSFTDWWKLTPDASGSYLNGTWTQLASLPAAWNYGPYAFASAVLADGRVLIEGGEYNLGGPFSLTNQGAIYDPVNDTWTQVDPPPGWDFIGDSASCVMPNGKFLLGQKARHARRRTRSCHDDVDGARFRRQEDFNAEEGWTLLPDGSILTVDVLEHAEHRTLRLHRCTRRGNMVEPWFDTASARLELSPSSDRVSRAERIRRRARRAHAFCGPTPRCSARGPPTISRPTSHTPRFFRSRRRDWTAGPDFPAGDDAGDTSAVLLPSGNVLVSGTSGRLYEFDGSALTPGPNGGGLMVTLPTGQALVSGSSVRIYTPGATPPPDPSWAPTLADWPTTLTPGATYPISGTQFNGLSQAQAFGDELQGPTNYPLVRITNNGSGHVAYARTHDHSTMGVATGDLPVSTNFDMPADLEPGPSALSVVANGIASTPVCVTVLPSADVIFSDTFDGCTL